MGETTVSCPGVVSQAVTPEYYRALVLPAPIAAWRRILRHPRLMASNRLIALVAAANMAVFAAAVHSGWWSSAGVRVDAVALVTQINFAIAIVVRQQFFVNLFQRALTAASKDLPLRVRWALAKGYHLGGVHKGAASAGTGWLVILAGSLTFEAAHGKAVSATTVVVYWVLMSVLIGIVVTALPRMRQKHHNTFERIHRFGGWAALALFWTVSVLLTNDRRGTHSLALAMVTSPPCWMLVITTALSMFPWLLLRRVPVEVTRPSPHAAVLRCATHTPFPGSARAIARHPLGEWHSFGAIPTPGETGFRLVVSRAGDWTGEFIDRPPSHVWIRGVPVAGVANYGALFRRVVVVATGSGIGPLLAHILAGKLAMRLIWITRDPVATYGPELVNEVLAVRPDTLIWDTDVHGRPDLVRLVYQAYLASGAEAVICVANRRATWQVVHGLERLGVPGLGPIWDS